MTKARIGGTTDLSTIDWHGKVTSMTFFAGCNFRCPYCQNASLIPTESGREMDTDEIFRRIEKNVDVIDAVGFSGGEPCLQVEALKDLARKARNLGLKVFLNTNCSTPAAIAELLDEGLLDYMGLDIKAPLKPESYGRVIGVTRTAEDITHKVRATLEKCLQKKAAFEVRTTIVPNLIDREEDVQEVAREIIGAPLYVLQQFSPEGDLLDQSFKNLTSPNREKLILLAKTAAQCGVREVRIRTRERGEEKVSP